MREDIKVPNIVANQLSLGGELGKRWKRRKMKMGKVSSLSEKSFSIFVIRSIRLHAKTVDRR